MSTNRLARVALGTVQLGLPYGRRRAAGALTEAEAFAILEAAWNAGIRAFDTAEAYGPAAQRLADWLRAAGVISQAHVTTKIARAAAADAAALAQAIERFDGVASVTLLSHGALEPAAFADFAERAARHGAPAGQSVYDAAEVETAAAAGAVRVQAPGNVLDRRQIAAAHSARVPIDVRSVFLQGLLLDAPADAAARVPGCEAAVRTLHDAAAAAHVSTAAALLNGVLAMLGADDRVVVGVDDPEQLADVTRSLDAPAARVADFMQRIAGTQLGAEASDPRTWSAP